jgi:hypothetical protein
MMDLDLKIIKSRRKKFIYWLHVELGKNIKKILYQKIK